jgi:NAD+ kinase
LSNTQTDAASPAEAPKRALVVVKQPLKAVAEASDDERLKKLLAPNTADHERLVRTALEHDQTLKHVVSVLSDLGVDARCVVRHPGEHFDVREDEKLVITVGGDGTFLDASHSVLDKVPMLGVNSAPHSSFGHFCLTDREGFQAVFASILSGKRKTYPLLRLKLTLDDEVVDIPVLNEVLLSHIIPAGTSRYKIEAGGQAANHKSSGLIISTPSGSTGFMRSAAGPIADITDKTFAFWVDKPFKTPGVPFPLRGAEVTDGKLVVTSEMIDGMLYIDGAHITRPFTHGTKLTVTVHESPLHAYIDPKCHDRFKADKWA